MTELHMKNTANNIKNVMICKNTCVLKTRTQVYDKKTLMQGRKREGKGQMVATREKKN